MNRDSHIVIQAGILPEHRTAAVALFWQAFKPKLAPVMKPEARALLFLESVVDPHHALSALSPDGALLGIAGFKTANGAFIGGELADLQVVYGWFGGLWRGLLLALLDRDIQPETFLMDGICVSTAARGQGVGTALLSAIKAEAGRVGCRQVRLDVIDTNPRARALYEREGFVARETSSIGPLSTVFGFKTSTTMVFTI